MDQTKPPQIIKPEDVEKRLLRLDEELQQCCKNLVWAEHAYMDAKTKYEVEFARQRMAIRQRGFNSGIKYTVNEIDDEALLACEEFFTKLNTTEAVVKAARENNKRVNTQIEITRSIGTNIRAQFSL